MADETVTIEIRATDRASGAIRKVTGALGGMATIAGGLIAFRTLERIASGIFSMGKKAAEAYEWFDRIRFSLHELSRADIVDGLMRGEVALEDWGDVAGQAAIKAKELLDWVIRLSLESPFAAEDVNKMFRLIRAYGFATTEAQSLTGVILDFAAATGFGAQVLERMGLALGQVRQRGKLAGEEIRQLINVGIPVRDIMAEALNVTTGELEKMIRAGKVLAEDALPAIVEWMKRFDGASERAVMTWQGLTANMKDVKDLNMIAVFEGIAKSMGPALQNIFDYMASEDFRGTMTSLGAGIGAFLAPIAENMPAAIELLGSLLLILKGLGTWATPATLLTFLANFFGIIESSDAVAVNQVLTNMAMGVSDFADSIENLFDQWIGPIKDDFPEWLDSITSIGTATWESFAPMFERFVQSLTDMSAIGGPQIIKNLTDTLANLDEWWGGGASDRAAEIVGFLLTLGGAGVVGGILWLTTAIGMLSDVLAGKDPTERLQAMGEAFRGFGEVVGSSEVMQGFAESLAMLFTPLPTAVEGETTTVANEIASNFMQSLGDQVLLEEESTSAQLKAALDAMGVTAESWGKMTGETKARVIGRLMASGLGEGFVDEMQNTKADMKRELQEMIDIMNEMYELRSPSRVFKRAGEQIMEGLGDGIQKGAKGAIKSVVKSTQAVIDAAKATLDISSPSKVLGEIGRQAMAGLTEGLGGQGAVGAMTQAASAPASPTLTPAGGGGTIIYAPTVSIADEREVRDKLTPLLSSAFHRGVRDRTISESIIRKKLAADII